MTPITIIALWAAIGAISFAGVAFADWYRGHDITMGDIAGLLPALILGPLILGVITVACFHNNSRKILIKGRRKP
jgi:hypothetical protein